MQEEYASVLQDKLTEANYEKLMALKNSKLHRFVADAIELCQPDSVLVCTDSAEDIALCRQLAINNAEEKPLAMEGHTAHFDGPKDQARDKATTKYLLAEGMDLGERLNATGRDEGLAELRSIFKGLMRDRQMLVRFFCLGPVNSPFSIPCVQITDSAYVAHSEDMLYRVGYEQFKRLGNSGEFFRYLHSAGKLGENNTSVDVDKRRIYIDIDEEMVYSVNTQYAGNTVGLKKLSLRLAIRKADRENWLAEHMFVMGVHGPKDRVTYFTGAFPSACGKTSTAMLTGETIIGDDIAYFRAINGQARCVNVENGIFGIIRDVKPQDDPVIYDVLTKPGEVIFGNVLINDGKPYWLGMGSELPADGVNYVGQWQRGMTDKDGNEITPSHKNARYTARLSDLANLDPRADDPDGVEVGGIVYGGRDSDTSVPVQQSFDWVHGVVTMGASLESETTSATLGAEGVRSFNLMSNLDFLAIPLGRYVQNHLDFGAKLKTTPLIFTVNYFLKAANGEYTNGMQDKGVWAKWMELRIHGDVQAIEAPTGLIPIYEDLKRMFQEVLGKEYTKEQYVEQFAIRIQQNLQKIERIDNIYRTEVLDTPQVLFDILDEQRERLLVAKEKYGDCVVPSKFV